MHTLWGRYALTAIAAATLLAACGGGDSSDTDGGNTSPVSSIVVMGDSLSDSGTFGTKFTVQGNDADGKPFKVWPEYVAAAYDNTPCPYYRATSATTFVTADSCLNYAVGGAQINPLGADGQRNTNTPLSVLRQIEDASAKGIASNALLLVDGGANDAAALVRATGAALSTSPPNTTALMGLLSSRISPAQLNAYFADGMTAGVAAAGAQYMEVLAQDLASSLKANVLDKGNARIALMNVPPITQTPQFSAAPDSLKGLANNWVSVFNTALEKELGYNSRVAIIDFHDQLQQQIASPSSYGYSNVTASVCASTMAPTCTATTLSGNPTTAGWASHMFADPFHPTPYGHQQISKFVMQSIEGKGWK